MIELGSVFRDAETAGSDLVYTVQYNSAPELITTTIDKVASALRLDYRPGSGKGIAAIIVRATDAAGCFGLARFSVAVTAAAPRILRQLTSGRAVVGQSATFTVVAAGDEPLSFHWYRGYAALAGQTNSVLEIASVDSGDVESYYAVITNFYGSVTSAVASLMLTPTIVANVGAQTDLAPGWRRSTKAKPLNIDGDNVLGTDGYKMVALAGAQPSYVAITLGGVTFDSVPSQITEDFTDGNDDGWVHSDGLAGAVANYVPATFAVTDGQYHITIPKPTANPYGYLRTFPYRGDQIFTDFEVSVDLTAWDAAGGAWPGVVGRMGNIGLGQTAILIGNGAGGFSNASLIEIGDNPTDVAVADLNQDQRPDLVVAPQFGNRFEVLFNRGKPAVGLPVVRLDWPLESEGYGLETADVVGGTWTPVNATTVEIPGQRRAVDVEQTGAQKYLRLRKP